MRRPREYSRNPMFFKIVLPLLAIVAIYYLGRAHAVRQGERALQRAEQGRLPPLPAAPEPFSFAQRFKWGAYALAVLMTLSASWFLYSHLSAGRETVTVTVVNIQTGQQATYRAQAREVHTRSFTTLEGKRITLADMERMEVGGVR